MVSVLAIERGREGGRERERDRHTNDTNQTNQTKKKFILVNPPNIYNHITCRKSRSRLALASS
jgi:hypothetical protein